MANSIYKLDLPEPFDWATNSGTTTDPGASRKATGFQVATRAPAKHFNWVFNLVGQWTRVVARSIINTFSFSAGPLASSVIPDNLVWMGSYWWLSAGSDVYYSDYGNTQVTTGVSLGGIPQLPHIRPLKDATGRLIVPRVTGLTTLDYATNPIAGSWTTVAPSIGTIKALGIALGGDRVMLGSSSGTISYAADIASSWTTPSTPFSGTPDVISIKHMGGTVWFAATDDGQTATSINNGVAWSLTTAQPSAESDFSLLSDADVNEVTGTICSFGETTTSEVPIYRSTDLGTSWVNTNTDVTYASVPISKKIRHFGGPLWVAIVEVTGIVAYVILVSADDGATWSELRLGGSWVSTGYLQGPYDMDCDGHVIRCIGKGASTITSGGV